MEGRSTTYERRRSAALLAVFAVVVVTAVIDLVTDEAEGVEAKHLVIETLLIAAGLIGAATVTMQWLTVERRARAAERESERLAARLEHVRREAAQYRAESRDLLEGLSAAIDRQLEIWQLTPAEKEVALLLLKGLSHKEVASLRSVSDATVRQQARTIYRKAGVAGRSELSAFFLEDLMLPVSQRDPELVG